MILKYKIIICLLCVFILAVPVIINPFIIDNMPKPSFTEYVLVFVICPIVMWLGINFSLKKYKQQLEKENKNK